ncbi:MAG: hypothetical protein SNJ77_09805 [Cytophagales bacterium]
MTLEFPDAPQKGEVFFLEKNGKKSKAMITGIYKKDSLVEILISREKGELYQQYYHFVVKQEM